MDKEQLHETSVTSWKVAAAMTPVFLGLLTVDWIWDKPLAVGVAIFVALLASLTGILGLWARVRLIRWSDDPKCPWGMWCEYEPVPESEDDFPGMRYRFNVSYPGSAESYDFSCNSEPVGEIEVYHYFPISGLKHIREPMRIHSRRGKTFRVALTGEYVTGPALGIEVTVRAPEAIYILKVRPNNSRWHRLWERFKGYLPAPDILDEDRLEPETTQQGPNDSG